MKILLVEDNPAHITLFKSWLESASHEVDVACSKDTALVMLNKAAYDVAVIDFVLVASTGDTVARTASARNVGVVMMTAAQQDSVVEDLVESLSLLGCKTSCVLRKPLTPGILLVAVNKAYADAKSLPREGGGS